MTATAKERGEARIEKAYIAGFIDGEGCIYIEKEENKGKYKRHRYQLKISISQQDKSPLEFIQKVYGGNFGTTPGGIYKRVPNPIYRLRITDRKALKLIKECLPFFIVKKEHTDIAIEFYKFKDEHVRAYKRTPDNILKELAAFKEKLHMLNQGKVE